MGQFTIRVKPEIIQAQVKAAETRDIDKLAQQFQLDKTQIDGDGVDINEASHLPYDAFMQLSGNDTKITKADLLKFAGTPTADDVVREYAQRVADSVPIKTMDSAGTGNGNDAVAQLEFRVGKKGQDIIIRAERTMLNSPTEPKTDPTASAVFSVIGGRDLNADGSITVGAELQGSVFVQTAGDAIKLAGSDLVVSPVEALKAIFEKAGKFGNLSPAHLDIEYSTGK